MTQVIIAKSIVVGVVFIFGVGYILGQNNSDAMDKCQKTHSYSVCFHQLNR